jgi:hypothetical protein
MADQAAMQMMFQRLGCTVAAAQAIVNDQGIDSLAELMALKEVDVETLCKVIHRPGGAVINPNAAAQGQPAQIANVGHQISLCAEMNIKLTSFYVRHRLTRVSRPCEIGTITIDAIHSLRELSESENKHKDPNSKPKIDNRDWPRTMEAINDYLGRVLGEENIPLAYVVRREAQVPATADDPKTNYANPNAEMICRAPH